MDPRLEFFPIDGGQFAEVWPQAFGIADVDVLDLVLGNIRIPVYEHANAAWQRAGNSHFVAAQQRHVEPAKLTGREGRELGVEVRRSGEDGAGHVTAVDVVAPHHEGKKLPRGGQDFFTGVFGDGGRSADSTAIRHVQIG